MGPKEDKPGKYFVYWHSSGSTTQQIHSISIIENTQYLMMFCSDMKWHKFDINISAESWAKVMDLFLHGACTSIPPISVRDVIDYISDYE